MDHRLSGLGLPSNSRCGRLLEAVSPPELLAEAFHAAGGIDKLLLAGEERMARTADIDVNLGLRTSGDKRVAAGAFNGAGNVTGMDFFFHD